MRENVRNNFWKKILKPLIKDRTDKIELTEKDKLEIGELNPGWIFIILTSVGPWCQTSPDLPNCPLDRSPLDKN